MTTTDTPALYHGTSSERLDAILAGGLTAPALTDDPDLAGYYADCCCDEDGGDPVVLLVAVTDAAALSVDLPAIEEPVLCCETGQRHKRAGAERGVSAEEALWAAAHAACAADGVDTWAGLSWRRSLELTNSLRCTADIPAADVSVDDD